MITRIRTGLIALIALSSYLPLTLAAAANTTNTTTSGNDGTRWIEYTEPNGDVVYLADNRKPALYTQNYGDCLGNSLINVTRFDAAYYNDNMTVLIHLAGHTAILNDFVMLYVGVFAYGESRFDLIANPCNTELNGLCPLNSTIAISANGIIPASPSDVANVPSIAYSIPDFEGEAILRIFSNTTQQEIACYSGAVTNGNTFSQPASVGTVLGVFALIAVIASFATAIYGEAVPTMRLHYAHSMSVAVVFSVFQHIFYTGALSVNWPSVLVAWWSNFAWAGGMINVSSMQNSINDFIGNNVGNTSETGAAQAGSYQSNVGGGFSPSLIYKRLLSSGMQRPANHPLVRDIAAEIYGRSYDKTLKRDIVQRAVEKRLVARDTLANASTGYKWYGHAVGAGIPLPGNYSGFAGTLSEEGLRVSNAFMTGFLWFLILLAGIVGSVILFKLLLEGLARVKSITSVKNDTLTFFRKHWIGYTVLAALRTCYIAFFMIMLLTIFQFTYQSPAGVKAVAAIVFAIFLIGLSGAAYYAVWYERNITERREQRSSERKRLLGKMPWFAVQKVRAEEQADEEHRAVDGSKSSSAPFWKRRTTGDDRRAVHNDGEINVHDDEDFTVKFGWLAARFRRSRWWFFTYCLAYEFIRAIFYGGASGYALAQVFGLLIIEVCAFAFVIWAKPFEGQRLNIIVVYCLGFSKVATVALSASFDVQFNVPRITTTVIGVVIIVIQGILTIITMIAIVVGAVSAYMSVSRNTATQDFRPRKWATLRERYFDHLDRAVNDLPPEPKVKAVPPPPEEPKYGFEMKNMTRLAKIEDEDAAFSSELRLDTGPYSAIGQSRVASSVMGSGVNSPVHRSRTGSMHSINLPYGARPHRPSWSARDFTPVSLSGIAPTEHTYSPIDMNATVAEDVIVAPTPSYTRHGRKVSHSSSLNNMLATTETPAPQAEHPPISAESFRVGSEVSTRDSIGKVPAPTSRPRAGSVRGSRPNSRSSGLLLNTIDGSHEEAESSTDGAKPRPAYTMTGGAGRSQETREE